MKIKVTHIDTACFILDINGFRILTDPVLDPVGGFYHFGWGTFSKKKSSPSVSANALGKIDLVLLSHDQHEDNLDKAGREFIKSVPKVISTKPAEKRIPGITGLKEWESVAIPNSKVKNLKITAVPAQHTSLRILNPIAGKVIGFILEWENQKNGVYYVSGDTVLFSGIYQIAEKFPNIDTAFFHTGRAGFPYLTGPIYYTFHSKEALKALDILNPEKMIPVHYDGWWHFRENFQKAKANYSLSPANQKILILQKGIATEISN